MKYDQSHLLLNARQLASTLLEDESAEPPLGDSFGISPTTGVEGRLSAHDLLTQTQSYSGFDVTLYQDFLRKLQGKRRRKIGNNTYLEQHDNGIGLRLHATDVVFVTPDNTITVNTDGWWTVTSKDRINSCDMGGWRIYQKNNTWYWMNPGTKINVGELTRRDLAYYTYHDGDKILPDGTLQRNVS